MRAHLLLGAIVIAGLAGCPTGNGVTSGAETPAPEPRVATPTVPSQPIPTLPSPSACQLDTDCTVAVSAPDNGNLCCDRTVTAQPIATAYLQTVAAWRATACAAATCPPQMLPGAQLAPCGYEPRCIAGSCNNACNLPTTAPTNHGGDVP